MKTDTKDTVWYAQTSSTQTMRTWARRIRSHDELPDAFRGVVQADEHPFPYTVYVPDDRFSLFGRRRAKLLCVFEDRLLLCEAQGEQIATSSSAFDDVIFVMRGIILLTSWIIIRTLSGTFSVKFNTTNLEYFEPVLEALRTHAGSSFSTEDVEEAERAKFDFLSSINYKYMNYGRQSLHAGDTILSMAYQPERCIQTGVSIFHTTLFRRYATSHLAVLTEQELLLIKEVKATRYEHTNLYGGVFTYIPRSKIRHIDFVPEQRQSLCCMTITLPENGRVTAEFSQDNASLSSFQHACRVFQKD